MGTIPTLTLSENGFDWIIQRESSCYMVYDDDDNDDNAAVAVAVVVAVAFDIISIARKFNSRIGINAALTISQYRMQIPIF